MTPNCALVSTLLVATLFCGIVDSRVSSSSYRYSRYSYGYRSSTSTSSYTRYAYRYSSSYDSYRASSVVYTPTRYTTSYYSPSSYSSYYYYTGLYYSYYYYTYYSYYYGGTCTYSSYGSSSSDSCTMSTTTTAAPTTSPPAAISCSSGTTLSSSAGSFNSHNAFGTSSYTNSMSCSWIIAASAGNIIQLSFPQFDTEKNYDVVRVHDGTSSSASRLGSFDGSSSADYSYPGATVVYSSGQYMYISFTTDSSITKNGFSAFYQQVAASSVTGSSAATTPASATTTTLDPTVTYCSGVQTHNANSSAVIASHSANSGSTLPSQTSGLGSYLNNMNCTWIIPGRVGLYLRFSVVYMNLESCYDRLIVREPGLSSTTFCYATTPVGYSAVVNFASRGSGATVSFTSDYSVTRQGFLMVYSYSSSYVPTNFTSSSSSSSSSSDSLSSRTSNNVCRNYQVNSNGSAMGSFTCPNPFEPSDYTQCCGDTDKQYCCKLQDNTPMIIGISMGIICLLIVVTVIIFCCVGGCRESAAKKSGSAVKWRRTMNKARAVIAWKRTTTTSAGGGRHVVAADAATLVGASGGKGGKGGKGGASSGATIFAAASDGDYLGGGGGFTNVEQSTFSPPPVPPPSALYYGAYNKSGGGGSTYPPPLPQDTAYPPAGPPYGQQPFRI